jgi:hypothetical protein
VPADPDLERDRDFDDSVDEEEAVLICGREFLRSEILALYPALYREALAEWRERQRTELLDDVVDRFPQPIAHCLYRFLNSWRTQNERLQFLKDTWEAIIAVVFALTAAEVRVRGAKICVTTDKVRDFKRYVDSQNIRDRLEVVRVSLDASVEPSLLRSVLTEQIIKQLIDLNERRNMDFAHISTLTESKAAELVGELEPQVVSILDALAALKDIDMVRYEGPGKRGEGRFETFKGHASTRTITARALSRPAASAIAGRSKEEVFLLRDDDALPLSPMIVVRDGRGHRSELAFMKKRRVEDARTVFTFETFGVPEEFESDAADLQADLDAVKVCFVQGEEGRHERDQ